MGLKAYKVSGKLMGLLSRALGIRIRVTGTENLVCRPTLFAPNHFTRVETFLVPYIIHKYAGRHVRSLGTHSVFKGLFGRYFEAVGGMSTRHPRRNRTIVRELMTCRNDWVIYPEGGLIKNKKTIHRGRYHLDQPDRQGPPHTGAAMLALKAEIGKRRYLDACKDDDLHRTEFYEAAYGLRGPQSICSQGIVMVPVTLTFYPMRPSRNLANRLARLLVRDIDPRIDEELTVEGSILLKGSEICIHFGEPIEVADYLGKVVAVARKVAGMFNEERGAELFLRKQARRLTDACMHGVYSNIEVSFDHLFTYGLRVFNGDRIQIDDLRAALYLTARELDGNESVRLHPTMRNGITALVTGDAFPPWDTILALARREKVIRVDRDHLVIDRQRLDEKHGFHTIRLHKMTQVLANEVEPVRPAVESVQLNVNLPTAQLRKRTAAALRDHEAEVFQRDYAEAFDPDESKDKDFGEPFLLEATNARAGVILSHGYLASPEQVRPLAEYICNQGYSVYALRLPGHGTAPDQMNGVSWQDWLEGLSRAMALLRHQCDTVVAGGFSLGGTLALLLASRQADTVAGVFGINAPGKLRDRRVPLVGAIVRFNGWMRRLGLSRRYYSISNEGTESPDINYGVDYLRGIRELRRAMKACYRGLGDVRAPALLLQGDHDPLVDPDGGRLLLQRLGSEDKLLSTMPFDRHLIIRDEGSNDVFAAVCRFLDRVTVPRQPASREARISA